MADASDFLTVAEAALRLDRTEQHVRRLVRGGVLIGRKVGRDWAIEPSSVQRYLAQRANLPLQLEPRRRPN
jgi:excisionase family DNA binding protein